MKKKAENKERILGRLLAKDISLEELKKATAGVESEQIIGTGTCTTSCSCDCDDCD